ncbi:hypothetical protein M9H77_18705 [Catharanthus roseus]|uniref:Uncharacterized protein n=1 Tax=Catharanthus roseus TaxID=4058 RepID=A0ACC0B858_CATRO|nr:hypothetical protein M9H77_18705 [Catharanthus roseus]
MKVEIKGKMRKHSLVAKVTSLSPTKPLIGVDWSASLRGGLEKVLGKLYLTVPHLAELRLIFDKIVLSNLCLNAENPLSHVQNDGQKTDKMTNKRVDSFPFMGEKHKQTQGLKEGGRDVASSKEPISALLADHLSNTYSAYRRQVQRGL